LSGGWEIRKVIVSVIMMWLWEWDGTENLRDMWVIEQNQLWLYDEAPVFDHTPTAQRKGRQTGR